jgi:hypothetical protein
MTKTPALRKIRQEDFNFKASPYYIGKTLSQKQKTKQNKRTQTKTTKSNRRIK